MMLKTSQTSKVANRTSFRTFLPQLFRNPSALRFFKGAFKIGSRSASRRGNAWLSLQCQFWNVMHCAPPGATYNAKEKPQHPFPRLRLLPNSSS